MNDVQACPVCDFPHPTTCNVCGKQACGCPTCDVYLRLSEDPYGDELGIERQYDECEPKATQSGWRIRHVWADNDLSATTGVLRPAFEGLLVHAPERVLCWHSDRFIRRNEDLERVIRLNVDVHTIHAGTFDLATPAGRAVARTVTAWAQYEGEQKALRQKAANWQRVKAGGITKTGRPWWPTRPLGFNLDATHHEVEAPALRHIYAHMLDGRTLAAAVRYLDSLGIVAERSGKPWKASSLRPVLLNARNAGIYVYNGEEVGPAAWEPIVSEDVYRAVVRILSDPSRNKTPYRGGRGKRENLLTGIARCAKCDHTVRVAWRRNGAGERTYKVYQCGGCKSVTLPAEWCDSVVVRKVIEKVEMWRDRLPDGLHDREGIDPAALRTEETALRSRKAELGELFADGLIDRQALMAGVKRADQRLAQIADALAEHAVASHGFNIYDVDALWSWTGDDEGDSYDLEKLTPVIARVCKRIAMTGPGKGRKVYRYGEQVVIEFNEP